MSTSGISIFGKSILGKLISGISSLISGTSVSGKSNIFPISGISTSKIYIR